MQCVFIYAIIYKGLSYIRIYHSLNKIRVKNLFFCIHFQILITDARLKCKLYVVDFRSHKHIICQIHKMLCSLKNGNIWNGTCSIKIKIDIHHNLTFWIMTNWIYIKVSIYSKIQLKHIKIIFNTSDNRLTMLRSLQTVFCIFFSVMSS